MNEPLIRPTSSMESMHRVRQTGSRPTSQETSGQVSDKAPTASTAETGRLESTNHTAWISNLPIEILRDPHATLAEWAWRKEVSTLNQSAPSQQWEPGSSEFVSDAVSNESVVAYEKLWSVLAELSSRDVGEAWQAQIPLPAAVDFSNPATLLIGLSSLSELPNRWPDVLKKLVLRDRLVSSVHDGGATQSGEGLFIPAPTEALVAPLQGEIPQNQTVRVHRWHADRHSMPTADGRVVHHIRLNLEVDNHPVELTVLSCEPSLSIHLATNHRQLRDYCQAAEDLRQVIRGLGWQLDRWSVSELDKGSEV